MTRKPTPNILDDVLSPNPPSSAPAEPATVVVGKIKSDGGTQMRSGLDDATVQEYADVMAETGWGNFPPVVLYHDGTDYWLADGFHRVAAYRRLAAVSDTLIPADVRSGTRRDAILHAAGANASHGLRRTNADKRRAVEVLLRDEEWQKWSDAEIARRCEVSQPFVSNLRKQLASSYNDYKMPEDRTVTRGGVQYTQNTANIGGNRPSPLAPPAGPKLPITDWEVSDICETIASEVYGDDLQFLRTYYAMMSSADQQSGEYWEKLMRVLAPFDLTPQRIQQAVHTQAKQMMAERRLTKAQAQDAATPAPVSAPRPSPLAPPAHAPYAPVWQIQQALSAWSKHLAPSELRNLARYRGGAQWFAARQALGALQYRDRDLVQALNNLADHGAHAAEPPSDNSEGQKERTEQPPHPFPSPSAVVSPSHNAFLSDDDPDDDGAIQTEAQDIRIGQCSRLINVYRQAIAAETEYGRLTGCFTEPLAAKREMEKLIKRLLHTIDLLEGRSAETPEECD